MNVPHIPNYQYSLISSYYMRLGLKEVQVQLATDIFNTGGSRCLGCSNSGIGAMVLETNTSVFPEREIVDTYAHEAVHLLNDQLGLGLSEDVVNTLASAFLSLVRDSGWSTDEIMYKKIITGGLYGKPE